MSDKQSSEIKEFLAGAERFREKTRLDHASATQNTILDVFEQSSKIQPTFPVWPWAIELQKIFADPQWREQHADYEVSTVIGDDKSFAVVFSSNVRGAPEMFLSIQATEREVPRLHEILPKDVIDEILPMIQDINSEDRGVAAVLVEAAFQHFRKEDLYITTIGGDPEENSYDAQAYTKDRKYILDIQVDYAVIQEDIAFRNKGK